MKAKQIDNKLVLTWEKGDEIKQGETITIDLISQKTNELLLDQLYRMEGVLGKYNCQHGGTKCEFQTNCHRLIREEIDLLKEEQKDENLCN